MLVSEIFLFSYSLIIVLFFCYFTGLNTHTSLLDSKILAHHTSISPAPSGEMPNLGSLRVLFYDQWNHVCSTFLINSKLAGTTAICIESIRHLEFENFHNARVVFGTNTLVPGNKVEFGIQSVETPNEHKKKRIEDVNDFGLILVGLLQ